MEESDNVSLAVIADAQENSQDRQNASRIVKPLLGPFDDLMARKPPVGFEHVEVPPPFAALQETFNKMHKLRKVQNKAMCTSVYLLLMF